MMIEAKNRDLWIDVTTTKEQQEVEEFYTTRGYRWKTVPIGKVAYISVYDKEKIIWWSKRSPSVCPTGHYGEQLSFSEWKERFVTSPAAIKYDAEKPLMHLLDPFATTEIAKALSYGAKKYDDHNWRKGLKWSRMYSAVLRHLLAWWGGEDKDPESGLSHLAHAGAGIIFLLWNEEHKKECDDRWRSK